VTKKPTDRNKDYFEGRLIREKPVHYADLLAGKYKTVTEAAKAAGLMPTRTRLQELKNAFLKATKLEQDEFKRLIGCMPAVVPAPTPAGPFTGPVAIDRRLTSASTARIQEIMDMRALKMGEVMVELGRKSLNASLACALWRGSRLQPDLIEALELWLKANKAV
jgi:hypothetical protein